MRLLWWAFIIAFSGVSTAQAQTSAPQDGVRIAPGQLTVAPNLRIHRNIADEDMSSFLVADKMETDENGKVILSGSAEVRRIDSVVKGDRIEYERSSGQVQVRGNGLIMRDASIVTGPELNYNLNKETGEINDPNFWLGASGGSGTASRAQIFSKSTMRLSDVNYSGCPCPEPAWYIKSPRVDMDFDENEGIARHGVLYFKDVPILYSPWLSFPLKKERKSGFLIPTYGMSSNSGLELSAPYYFNIAPNYDATLTPRYLSKRGLQLGGEFRYMGERYSGALEGTYLHDDKDTGERRWLFMARHAHALGGGLSASYDIRRVSDDDYFRDFSTFGLNESTNNYLTSRAGLDWSGYKYFRASLAAYKYQTLQDATTGYVAPQYDKLPELYVGAARYNWNGFDVKSDNYVTRFRMPFYSGSLQEFDAYRDRRIAPDGTRFSSYSTIAFPVVRAGWYVTPKFGMHLSQYNTEWYADEPGRGVYNAYPGTQSRAVPVLSLDSGMTFERNTTLFGNKSIQTLEPRVYYLYVPYRDQSQIPVFDTDIATFNFSQAFNENLFTGGWDRIANANQVTLGLTTRWLDEETGFERLSLSAAQRLYFDDQKVALPGGRGLRTDTKSDYLVGMNAALTDTLNVRFDAQFNPESNDRNRMSAGFRWTPKRLTTLSASYRYERDQNMLLPAYGDNPNYEDRTREQVSVSAQWPLTNKLYAMGRYDYSLQEKRGTQSILGLEYKGDCCWTARVVVQRYAVSKEDANSAVFFQLELSGLGSLGTDPMRLLRDRIIGYESVTPSIPDTTTFERYE
ncbi:LPS-assembly protein LptD [Pusillimonas sp. MFBS29]|uniref:LPS-assembly protein LptD n=1 Tax=Pusillimonas sp. MFBS29 TaxID=2886690 RepID=UPI001D111727|nr:LPS-assembly protein LptD [Pusillimonas sp. MFBS29]